MPVQNLGGKIAPAVLWNRHTSTILLSSLNLTPSHVLPHGRTTVNPKNNDPIAAYTKTRLQYTLAAPPCPSLMATISADSPVFSSTIRSLDAW